VPKNEYKLEVDSPYEHTIRVPERSEIGYAPIPKDLRTLYDISEKAFPRKWKKELGRAA
jgi:hypothetical protein